MQPVEQKIQITPERILQIGAGFMASKLLLTAVELQLFTQLARGPLDAATIGEKLGLNPRSLRDFLDALVALQIINRDAEGLYSNSPDADLFLDREKPTYTGGLLEMFNARLYGHWGSLREGLETGKPQNEFKNKEFSFEAFYADADRLKGFLEAMSGISLGSAQALAKKFPWKQYRSFIDIGAAQGCVPVQVAQANPHLQGGGFDLPAVRPIFEDYVAKNGVADRVRFHPGDFFREPLPSADVLIMGHILHDWNLEEKRILLKKAYDALPEGGALVVYETLIDDDRRTNAFGLLMSLNMLVETNGGFDYTGAECTAWMKEVGFREVRVEHLLGPDSMVIGIK